MHGAVGARLGRGASRLSWVIEPAGDVNDAGRSFLLGRLLSAPLAAIMGSVSGAIVVAAALLRSGDPSYRSLLLLEGVIIIWRLADLWWRTRRSRSDPAVVLTIDTTVSISVLWCALQGASVFTIMTGDDPAIRVVSATLVMALTGPICARNYAAPRFAFLLLLLFALPFVAGVIASGEPWLAVILLITPPFLIGAMQTIMTFHQTLLVTLAAEANNLHLAQHDSLTGILNRQGMDAALCRIQPRSERKMALIAIDLDGFKQVNDRYGHGAGDLLLVEVARRIQESLGGGHLLGRMGGDEFMVVLRDVEPEEVDPSVVELIAAVSHRPYDLGNGTIARVGASIGYACLPEDAASSAELRLRADQALYAAKGAGKGLGLRYRESLSEDTQRSAGVGQARSAFSLIEQRQTAL